MRYYSFVSPIKGRQPTTRGVIESILFDFLDSPKPEVLAISGKWGVGKTYTVQSIVSEYSGKGSLSRYSYVSAFGVRSIGDLRSTILIKTRPLPVQKDKLGKALERTETIFARGRGKAIGDAFKGLSEKIPYVGKPVTVLLETIATSLINRTVVCIDDIERLAGR
ncbi:P-loop NTPase fold protein [Paraburkholderia mimosarum]|uniref:P-loop NTPase fold protein n=1 Tax=Paraburkholderia mimosarum TaxID=312026 RepID=UPI00047FE7A7